MLIVSRIRLNKCKFAFFNGIIYNRQISCESKKIFQKRFYFKWRMVDIYVVTKSSKWLRVTCSHIIYSWSKKTNFIDYQLKVCFSIYICTFFFFAKFYLDWIPGSVRKIDSKFFPRWS